MQSHVDHYRHSMFQESVNHVRQLLSGLAKEAETMLADKTDEVFVQMKRDYLSVLGGEIISHDGDILPKIQRQVRKETMHTIDGVEKMMKRVVGIEVEEATDDDDDLEKEDSEINLEDDVDNDETGTESENRSQTSSNHEGRPSKQPSDPLNNKNPTTKPQDWSLEEISSSPDSSEESEYPTASEER